jgi:hypothetical protein
MYYEFNNYYYVIRSKTLLSVQIVQIKCICVNSLMYLEVEVKQ